MTTRHIATLQALFALVVLAGLVWGLYLASAAALRTVMTLESDVAVAVIAASATVIVSVVSLFVSKRLDSRAAIRQELRTKKVPIYEGIIETLFKVLYAEKMGEQPMTEQELIRFFAASTEQMVIWGSDDVIREYRSFRTHFTSAAETDSPEAANPILGLFKFEDLMMAIRKDLGHSNKGFNRGTILGLWINDIDDLLPPR